MLAMTLYSLNLDSNLLDMKGQATKFIRDIFLRLNVNTLEAVIMWHIFFLVFFIEYSYELVGKRQQTLAWRRMMMRS